MLSLKTHIESIKADLEERSWAVIDLGIDDQVIQDCKSKVFGKEHDFSDAKVNKDQVAPSVSQIRKSQVLWVENWDEFKLTQELSSFNKVLIHELNSYFFLAMKSFESQFAYYKEGDFYKKHLDQYRNKGIRQLTTVFFLNDCAKSGELVIYNKDDSDIIDIKIKPKRGNLVLFFSSQIYHEVLPVKTERYSLTTWFRDDQDLFRT